MTNREKYIDNASNEEIASALCGMGLQYRYSPDTQLRVKEWLSQEAEEEIASPIMSKALMKVDEKMAKLERRINENRIRIDKLEEERKKRDPKDFATCDTQSSDYGCGSVPLEKSADEMFEELGYEKMREDKCVFGYRKVVNSEIIIIEITYQGKREITFSKLRDLIGVALADNITEAEDKAIHKKIEELKCI